jgi:chaperone required for assembly of F1-ATPase
MRDDPMKSASPGASNDPIALARRNQKKPLSKRFYRKVTVSARDGGFAVMLDGRAAKTPAKADLVLPTLAAAEAVAAEWEAQREHIDLASMPLARIVNAAIDGVAHEIEAVAAEIVKYGETDLVCYRAAEPASLVKAQSEAWDPILAFAAARLGARFICAEGVAFVAQPAAAKAAVRAKIDAVIRSGAAAPLALACLSVMTALTGSALIALALADGAITLEQAWAAAHVDEDFQARLWGQDPEAMARGVRSFAEIAAAERLWRLIAA